MKRYKSLLLFLVASTLVFQFITPEYTQAGTLNHKKVLVVYDGLSFHTAHSDNVAYIVRQLTSMGRQVTLTDLAHYKSKTVNEFDNIVYIVNTENNNNLSGKFENDLIQYKGHFFQIGGSLISKYSNLLRLRTQVASGTTRMSVHDQELEQILRGSDTRYISDGKGTLLGRVSMNGQKTGSIGILNEHNHIGYMANLTNNLSLKLLVADLLKKWLSIKGQGAAYLTLTDITPFSNFKVIRYVAKELYDRGIPFIAVAQPVFSHLKSDAMLRYLNVLNELQSRNGALFIGSPVVYKTDVNDNQLLQRQMDAFINTLADHHIAPLGISSQNYWLFDRQYRKQGLGFFSAVINTENDAHLYWRDKTETALVKETQLFSLPFQQVVSLNLPEWAQLDLPMNTALTYSITHFKTMSSIKQFLKEIDTYPITINDFMRNDLETKSSRHHIEQKNGEIFIDGAPINHDILKQIELKKQKIQKKKSQKQIIFARQNRFLILLFSSVLVLFIVFLLISRRYYKRKYLKD
ncbi:hypothetical protein M3N64_00735 [Sporolactobacillus sp. CPB3-1]|uniref:DUF2334 domain-containing protein n=1 Tax=Sporolactobacillus mangiferae TaxID=2940498 RepID=A0ABT0M6I9_9BACL|nr:hypothetical protein [Sporolactobacillus mangiferae]MCL1630479.1 hypothetical protein [Sporolactobacillus mangiferae]